MSDSFDVDAALISKLQADAALMALTSDGVYYGVAAQNKTKFVIVSLIDSLDEPQFGGRAFEQALYMVKAVALEGTPTITKAAAARIDALLDGQPLTVPGYSHMITRRESRFREIEVDDADPNIRWQHRGGNFLVMVSQ